MNLLLKFSLVDKGARQTGKVSEVPFFHFHIHGFRCTFLPRNRKILCVPTSSRLLDPFSGETQFGVTNSNDFPSADRNTNERMYELRNHRQRREDTISTNNIAVKGNENGCYNCVWSVMVQSQMEREKKRWNSIRTFRNFW